MPEMASRLLWVKATVRGAIQDGGDYYSHSDDRTRKGSSQCSRFIKGNLENNSVRSYTTRERRRAAPGVHNRVEYGSALKEAVASLLTRVYKGTDLDSYFDVLRRCSQQSDFEAVKQVHDFMKKSGLEQNLNVANSLLKCYIDCGRLQNAQELFNSILEKNMVSWNIMIGGYAELDQADGAIEVYKQLREEGGQPDAITYLTVLKACASPTALQWGKFIHSHILHDCLQTHVRVCNALVNMYAKCGSVDDARKVFDSMVERNVISWNAIIGGLAKHGHGQEAFSLFQRMQREGFTPDSVTYLSILSPRADSKDLTWLKDVHKCASESGIAQDLRVGNALVHMYAKTGSFEVARAVFDSMKEHDVISWNGIIGALAQHGHGHEALSVFHQMQREGFTPNSTTYLSLLSASAYSKELAWVKEVHSHATKSGCAQDLRVSNALVHVYSRSGSVDYARSVFDSMKKRDVTSWTVMIGGLAQHGKLDEAFCLFNQMQREGFTPDKVTYLSILSARVEPKDLAWVKEIHSTLTKSNFANDLPVNNALIHIYAKCGSVDNAKLVFDSMMNRDATSWTAMIGGLAQDGLGHEAFSLFLDMKREGVVPNAATYLSILNSIACEGALVWVKEVHSHAVSSGLIADLRVGNALAHMFAKCGSIEDARKVFENMKERDVISWNVMIGGLAEHGFGHEAFSLFLQMQREGFEPNSVTYLSILNPLSSSGASEWVKEVHAHALKVCLDADLLVGNALVHMYSKIGNVADGRQVFNKMPDRDVVSWTTMIGGLAQHGQGREALQLFEEMKGKSVRPNRQSFLAVLSACNHAGLVDEGSFYFVSMKLDYLIEPWLEHYNCMVDILGRAGHLEEAMLFIRNMPITPDGVTWGALLGACRTYNNITMAELAAKETMSIKPMDSSSYVLLSNMYAALGKRDQVSAIRSLMRERGIRKDPGRCWIEVDNKIHQFVAADMSHPETREIYALLNGLSEKLKAEGYSPDTQLVLRDISEDEKESALCSHSEKLAVSYGLMHVSRGMSIRIFKNLRICTDCHTATKFISKVTEREIVIRDESRFHHFKDGVCSCGDYW